KNGPPLALFSGVRPVGWPSWFAFSAPKAPKMPYSGAFMARWKAHLSHRRIEPQDSTLRSSSGDEFCCPPKDRPHDRARAGTSGSLWIPETNKRWPPRPRKGVRSMHQKVTAKTAAELFREAAVLHGPRVAFGTRLKSRLWKPTTFQEIYDAGANLA